MENNHAYLRLSKLIVKKSSVGCLLEKYDKIEINKQINKGIKNGDVVKIIPYIYINFSDFRTILGSCKKYFYLNIPLLTGICSSNNEISYKSIKKLIKIEKEFNINLSISNDIINKINENT